MQKIQAFIFLLSAVWLSGCNSPSADHNEFPGPHAAAQMDSIMGKFKTPSQTFSVSSSKPSKISGKNGTLIHINPQNLETASGRPLGKTIEVELKELKGRDQFISENVQTVSNGELLTSGGAYFIGMTSGGETLKLKPAKTLQVNFPRFSNKEMSIFYGQRDRMEQMNWLPSGQKLRIRKAKSKPIVAKGTSSGDLTDQLLDYVDTAGSNLPKQSKNQSGAANSADTALTDISYDMAELNQLGWINCDRFADVNLKTDVTYKLPKSVHITSAGIYLIFKDMNSAMRNLWWDGRMEDAFVNVPVGANVRLLVITSQDGKIFSYHSDFRVTEDKSVQIELTETPEEELGALFKIQ
jgi:hypothetical protein